MTDDMTVPLLRGFWADQSGGTGIEYGLIAGALAITIAAAVRGVGGETTVPFERVAAGFKDIDP